MNFIKRQLQNLRALIRAIRIKGLESQIATLDKAAFRARRAGLLTFMGAVTTVEKVRAMDAYNDARMLEEEAEALRIRVKGLRGG